MVFVFHVSDMRLLFLLVVIVTLQGQAPTPSKSGEPLQQQLTRSQQTSTANQRGTEDSPLMIKVIPTPKTKEELERETQESKGKASSDWWNVRLAFFLALTAFLQLLVYVYQSKKLRETVESAKNQGEAMERHIGEAARSASAMESISAKLEEGNRAMLRAYLTVVVGGAIFQQREENRQGGGDVKFEGKPTLINTGNSPARNVVIRIAADILPVPIPDDFTFPIPNEPPKPAGVVGPRWQYQMGATVKDFVPDNEVAEIKHGNSRVLCVWGVVTYDDIFGEKHTTKFGQSLTWWANDTLYGYYIQGQNDTD